MGYISIGTEELYYHQMGTGKRILLAFHGYGEDCSSFSHFEKYIAHTYTILAFDLPHHGKSNWPQNTPFTRKDLLALIIAVKDAFSVDKVSLMGYSLGGRICLTILELVPASIDKIILIATDGLEVNGYYHFYTRTAIGKKLFRHMLTKPAKYFAMLNMLKQLRIVNTSRYKFVMHSIQSPEKRMFLLQVWPCLSDLIPSPAKIKQLINQYQVPVVIFMGAYDRILPPSIAKKFATGMNTVEVFVVEQGHRLLNNETTKQIASKLL